MSFPQGGVSSVETPLVLMGMMSLLVQQVVVIGPAGCCKLSTGTSLGSFSHMCLPFSAMNGSFRSLGRKKRNAMLFGFQNQGLKLLSFLYKLTSAGSSL